MHSFFIRMYSEKTEKSFALFTADSLSDLAGEDVLRSRDQHSGCRKSKGVQRDTKRGKNKINIYYF